MRKRSRTIFKIGAIVALILAFSGYGLYKAKDFLAGPKITIEYPQNGQFLSRSYNKIKGKAANVSNIHINGRQVFADKDGKFEEGLLLAMGYNIIEVKATDKFEREIKKLIEVVYK
jgi:hypothetical protein